MINPSNAEEIFEIEKFTLQFMGLELSPRSQNCDLHFTSSLKDLEMLKVSTQDALFGGYRFKY